MWLHNHGIGMGKSRAANLGIQKDSKANRSTRSDENFPMVVKINTYGQLDPNGEYEVKLTGSYSWSFEGGYYYEVASSPIFPLLRIFSETIL